MPIWSSVTARLVTLAGSNTPHIRTDRVLLIFDSIWFDRSPEAGFYYQGKKDFSDYAKTAEGFYQGKIMW
jgi:hypothetical protein